MATTLEEKRKKAAEREKARLKKIADRKANIGKEGFDDYGVKKMSKRKKEQEENKKQERTKKFIADRKARDKKIKDNIARKEQVAKIKETMGYSDSSSKPKKQQPKRKKQKTASSVTKAGLVDLKNQIKISGPEKDLKKRPNITEEDRAKLDRLQKMKDRADKRQARKDRSTERLAFRMGEKATFQDAAALKQKRKQARKDYLRNFASQLARGEQAAPRTGFGEGEGNPNADTSLVGNSSKGTEQEVNNNNEVAKSEATAIESTLKTSGDNKILNNNFTNFNSAADDILADVMNTNINLTSSLNKIEDSTPIKYMQKQYRKKRGY